MPDRLSTPDPDVLLRLVWRLMRPLIRLLIVAGVPFPRLAELLRQLYVDVASRDLVTDPKARTDSRISLLTGVHRKELRRIRGVAFAQLELPEGVSLSTEIIGRWLGGAPWTDKAGQPRPLPRVAPKGKPSFDLLVASVTKDFRPRTVLEQWISQGLVSIDPSGNIVLQQEFLVPKPGQAEQLFYFSRNLHDHIAAAVANITASDVAPFLDRSVHYDRLSPDAAQRLRAHARNVAQCMLLNINREALRLVDADIPEGDTTERVNVGVYLFSEADRLFEERP
ncbi:MAG: DUF6502 family protein [Janthinobacterium lividum]